MPAFSPFPPLNHLCECETQYHDGTQVPLRDFAGLDGSGAYEQLAASANMRVVLAPELQAEKLEKVVSDNEETSVSSESVYVPHSLKSHLI